MATLLMSQCLVMRCGMLELCGVEWFETYGCINKVVKKVEYRFFDCHRELLKFIKPIARLGFLNFRRMQATLVKTHKYGIYP